jgi:hypothetical protein
LKQDLVDVNLVAIVTGVAPKTDFRLSSSEVKVDSTQNNGIIVEIIILEVKVSIILGIASMDVLFDTIPACATVVRVLN